MAGRQTELHDLTVEAGLLQEAIGLATDPQKVVDLQNALLQVRLRIEDINRQLVTQKEKSEAANKELARQREEAERLARAFQSYKTGIANLASSLSALGSRVGGLLTGLGGLFQPGPVRLYHLEVENLGAAFGSILAPALRTLTRLAEQLNVAVTNLSPEVKRLLTGLAGLATGVGMVGTAVRLLLPLFQAAFANPVTIVLAFVAATVAVGVAMGTAARSVRELVKGFVIFGPLIVALLGPLAPLVPLVAGIAYAIANWGQLGGAFKPLQDALAAVMAALDAIGDAVADVFEALFEAARPFVEYLVSEFVSAVQRAAQQVITLAAAITVLVKRFREGRLAQAGFWDEVQAAARKMQNRPAGDKTYASGQFRYASSLEEASKQLQLAGLNAGAGPDEKEVIKDHLPLISDYTRQIMLLVQAAVNAGLAADSSGAGLQRTVVNPAYTGEVIGRALREALLRL